ncbi:YihA family ribosome biogenesis GTP-binding protein [candidate division KSB1 bacterium]|nr:YihA family ribosome biogenesis GTP-binding protein [candidate division KSB1 bacterium]
MKIQSVEFLTSIAHVTKLPQTGYPEIAFSGRSNVGKSSLINCLLNRKKIAKTSSTPGKTRMLNFFTINEKFYFVDLPGYGFARVPESERQRWKTLIESYFANSRLLKGIVIIIDIRHELSPLDVNMMEWVAHLSIPAVIVATKADKLSTSQVHKSIAQKVKQVDQFQIREIIPFSSETRMGRRELWQAIERLLKEDTK